MASLQILQSKQDSSVNFVSSIQEGFFESRYVRRGDYFIAYLSAQSACNRGCGFCHLTATGQTVGRDASKKDLLDQAKNVLSHYAMLKQERGEPPAPYMHFNFMARGEPLANAHLNDDVLTSLGELASRSRLPSKVNISTIMPKTLRKPLAERFMYTKPTLYYSMYSTKDDFRSKWLPGAMPHEQALEQLAEYNRVTGGAVKIHFAFIEGENDNWYEMVSISNAVKKAGLRDVSFNIVRYNPPDSSSKESSEQVISKNVAVLRNSFPVQVVTRVGFDVSASCGMFFQGDAASPLVSPAI
jgi:23S rRNA (adenine2503-C2)-methyltransferase